MNRQHDRFYSLRITPCLGTAFIVATALGAIFAMTTIRSERDFIRYEHEISDAPNETAGGLALVPGKSAGTRPVVIFLHGSGGSLSGDGRVLRRIAEAGCAGVGMEYSQRDSEEFHRQFAELLGWVREQPWADRERIVWLGFSLGAQRMLQHLVRHPESRPALFIRVAGGMVPGLKDAGSGSLAVKMPVWLVHGEHDRVFRLEDVREVKERLEGLGANVRLDVLPGLNHAFKEDRGMVIKLLVDRVVRFFESASGKGADPDG